MLIIHIITKNSQGVLAPLSVWTDSAASPQLMLMSVPVSSVFLMDIRVSDCSMQETTVLLLYQLAT